jgi:hypothetical protein
MEGEKSRFESKTTSRFLKLIKFMIASMFFGDN